MSASSDKPPSSSSSSAFAYSPINATSIWNKSSSSSSSSSNASLPKWSEATTSWPSQMTGLSLASDPLQSSHKHNNILTNRDEKENHNVNNVPRGDLPKRRGRCCSHREGAVVVCRSLASLTRRCHWRRPSGRFQVPAISSKLRSLSLSSSVVHLSGLLSAAKFPRSRTSFSPNPKPRIENLPRRE